QRAAVDLALSGASFFRGGQAGTGKSAALRAITAALTARHGRDAVGVTASTGLAAAALGGTTLHAWAGVGLATHPVEALVRYMRAPARARWRRTRVLLIDEVSMLSAAFLTTVADVGAGVLRDYTGAPFGGLQVIAVGDFLQLPPVAKPRWQRQQQRPQRHGGGGGADDAAADGDGDGHWVGGGGGGGDGFAFQSPVWNTLFPRTRLLTRVHRQADPAFVAVLNEVRVGALSPAGRAYLTARVAPPRPPDADGDADADTYVWLGSHKASVAARNEARLARIAAAAHVYEADDWAATAAAARRLPTLRPPPAVALKVGARVICTKNVAPAAGVVNGAAGVVVGFAPPPAGARRDAGGRLVVGPDRRGGGVGGAPPPDPDDALPLLDAAAVAAIPYRRLVAVCKTYRVDLSALPRRTGDALRAALTARVAAVAARRDAAAAAAAAA
ncbi:hypothetical protein BU14_2845s0001, partial [Porphyra umbilicalis]